MSSFELEDELSVLVYYVLELIIAAAATVFMIRLSYYAIKRPDRKYGLHVRVYKKGDRLIRVTIHEKRHVSQSNKAY